MNLNERGLKDGLSVLSEIKRIMHMRANDAERRYVEAESEMMACKKLLGFIEQQQAEFQAYLQALEDKKQ